MSDELTKEQREELEKLQHEIANKKGYELVDSISR